MKNGIKVKEKLSWYKLLFTLFATSLVACISWLVNNVETANFKLILIDFGAIAFLVICVTICAVAIICEIDKLEDE